MTGYQPPGSVSFPAAFLFARLTLPSAKKAIVFHTKFVTARDAPDEPAARGARHPGRKTVRVPAGLGAAAFGPKLRSCSIHQLPDLAAPMDRGLLPALLPRLRPSSSGTMEVV